MDISKIGKIGKNGKIGKKAINKKSEPFLTYSSTVPKFTKDNIFYPPFWGFRLKQIFYYLKFKHQQRKKGYCDSAVWNMCDWFVITISNMLDEFAENKNSYPHEFDNIDDWIKEIKEHSLLLRQCVAEDLIEGTEEDREYEDYLNNVYIVKDNFYSEEEVKEIRTNYFNKLKELNEVAENNRKEFFDWFNKYFWDLWD